MKFLKRIIALVIMLAMLVSPIFSNASAEYESWQSALLDVFRMILDEYVEDDYPDTVYDDKEYDEYSYDVDEQETYYQYDTPITDPQQIVNYLFEFGYLPDNFITKEEARELGWDSSRNYVGEIAPGMSIGGDKFGNYEGLLPDAKGRKWFECDANYKGKKRGAERVVFSSDGLFFYTDDHYESFTEMFPED